MNPLLRCTAATILLPLFLGWSQPSSAMAADEAKMEAPYVFTDAKAGVTVPATVTEVAYTVKTITPAGWGPATEGTAKVSNGRFELAPLAEGLHIVSLKLAKPAEVRFLAIQPPPTVDKQTALALLPHSGQKLFNGEKYTFASLGDSVTNTGDYESMLLMMLKRATGNSNITFVDRSYPGRSVDASVRNFKTDVVDSHPDLGLIMYGLNDQAGGCSLDGFLDQYRWLAEHLASECQADTVFLMPTPDISVDPDATEYAPYIFRTIGFAESLRPVARQLKIPLAETFHGIWGKGAMSVDASGRSMWPVYPQSYSQMFSSMLETSGKGDGIHAAALGHLAIARAAFNAMMGIKPQPQPLTFSAASEWNSTGLVSHVTVRNASNSRREGSLGVFPLPADEIKSDSAATYALEPGAELQFDVTWPKIKAPQDLLKYPANMYAAPGHATFVVLDFSGGGSHVYAVEAPPAVNANFVRERQVVSGQKVTVKLQEGGRTEAVAIEIPPNLQVGRVPLVRKIEQDGKTGYAVAELAYVKYAQARPGEPTIDGNLEEWADQQWVPVGESVQARWLEGIIDHRENPQECYLQWAFKAGNKGVYIAVKATGNIAKDNFTLFFDTRQPEILGTPGRYFWVSGTLKDKDQIALARGETSNAATGMKGAWKQTDTGATLEIFVPYDLMDSSAWPAAGDLGCSIWWRHVDPKGPQPTNLHWSEDGHPWNTRWYGVIRLDDGKPLPYMVRIK